MDARKKEIANQAHKRYTEDLSKISDTKAKISSTRLGITELADIQDDPGRLMKRISREGLSVPKALERINGVANFQDIQIIEKIAKLAKAVCRITVKSRYDNLGHGTGCLIAPGIIITNNHVLADPDTAATSFIQFDYELDSASNPKATSDFNLRPDKFFFTSTFEQIAGDPLSGLDFTIVAVEENSQQGKSIYEIPHAVLDENLGKILHGENCIVIQHPKGQFKKIVLKDIRMLDLKDNFLIYESDTLPGSSGSIVVAMGTGEIVALHHSGVPRKNDQGKWLTKDGQIVQDYHADDDIDWIGNEGIRTSSIIRTVKNCRLPAPMQPFKDIMLGNSIIVNGKRTDKIESLNDSSLYTNVENMPQNNSNTTIIPFEIQLAPDQKLLDDWRENYKQLCEGIITNEALFPLSTITEQKRFFYIQVQTHEDPWDLAEKLEALPHIDTCTPDLPTHTDIKEFQQGQDTPYESFNRGISNWKKSEDGFVQRWANSVLAGDSIQKRKKDEYRQWNRAAINLNGSVSSLFGKKTEPKAEFFKELREIKIIQLDTGYTDHAKVIDGFNLDADEDFIDGEDARDELSVGFLRHPRHGTRTASILVGNAIKSFTNDGNKGVLLEGDKLLCKVIPYRISKSVILIGRARNLFNAAYHAIKEEADVIFMCMGTYPRPMIYEVAKAAYDRGIIWVCAAGNEVGIVVAPALYPGTIAVAATNPNNEPWSGSSRGKAVDIAAPGEDVYVPTLNSDGKEIMAFGSGTSYATPHIASAAALWRAKYADQLRSVEGSWKMVEAFRACLKMSLMPPNKGSKWDTDKYGHGILDLKKLLNIPAGKFPKLDKLENAYGPGRKDGSRDLGMRTAVHHVWEKTALHGHEHYESFDTSSMTERARKTISALTREPSGNIFESTNRRSEIGPEEFLNIYFEPFQK